MTRHVLRTELLRGVAPLALIVVLGIGLVALFNEAEDWAGRWAGLAGYVRTVFIVLVPLGLAAGAWQGGRERRRRIDDLLGSVPCPPWRQTVLRWAGAALGVGGGFVVMFAVCAVLVARVATYSGGGWWWQVGVGLVALAAAVAIGFAAGRLIRWRVTAAVIGLAGYVGVGVLFYGEADGRRWLSPIITEPASGEYLPASFHALQAVWFVLLGAAALVLVGAGRRWVVAGPAVAAVAAGVVIVTGPDDRWQDDPAATEPVCVEGRPQVCTTREDEFLLDGLVAAADDQLASLDGIRGLPERIMGVRRWDGTQRDDIAAVHLRPYTTWRGTLSAEGQYGAVLANDLVYNYVPMARACDRSDAEDARTIGVASAVAAQWVGADPSLPMTLVSAAGGGGGTFRSGGSVSRLEPAELPEAEHLAAWTQAQQRSWLQRYVEAAASCDVPALTRLVERLR